MRLLPALALIATLLCLPSLAQDDGDVLPAAVEDVLGTSPDFAEELQDVGRFPATLTERPELDVVGVDFGNVATDRWLWAIRFAAPYSFENSSLILYIDTDNDPSTGRQGMGCEFMLAHRRGAPGVTAFSADGTNLPARAPRIAIHDGILYICFDCQIAQEDGASVFRYTVLSEIADPHESADSTGWQQARGPANSQRERVVGLEDITGDENFRVTEGLDLIWQLQADPGNVVISPVTAELEGLRYYDAEYRWPAVTGGSGKITVTVPRAGTFYPAVVVYDGGGREAYELSVEGRRLGRFVANENDRRQRIHFLSSPVTFEGGEGLSVRVGGEGSHITEDILLLAKEPPIRGRRFELSQVEAGFASVDGVDQERITWITTWPTACTVEYGPQGGPLWQVTEETPVANHRVHLADLQPGQTYHFTIRAPRPDGSVLQSESQSFTFEAPRPFKGAVTREHLPLNVENPYSSAVAAFPVNSGVPFSAGELGDPAHVRLLAVDGAEVPLQTKVGARWLDGSIKWLLVSFMADVAASTTATYALEYGSDVSATPSASPLRHAWDGDLLQVDTGPLRVQFDRRQSGFPSQVWVDADGDGTFADNEALAPERLMGVQLYREPGDPYSTNNPPESIQIEEAGPVRTVVKVTGHHLSEGGEPYFAYTNRFEFYSGSPFVRAYTTFGVDHEGPEFTTLEQLGLHIPLDRGRDWTWTVGMGRGQELSGREPLSLMQLHDDAYSIDPYPEQEAHTERADGWIDLSSEDFGLTVAVRDFWQLYPKGFRVADNELIVDLCPDFPEGTYDDCSKLDEIKLYYYLMGGKYKLKRGMQKQHELMLYFHPGRIDEAARRTAELFQEPLIAACTPERYCTTKVFGEVLPATAGRFPEYEEVCEKVFGNYTRHQQSSRGYGMLNYGDQFGERRVNWANGEYDHHHAFLMQFGRTADRRWYFLGEKAARHAIDVDTCHYGPRAGGVYIHSMGHVGGYFTEKYEGEGIPGAGFTPSHTWTEGFYDWYALSGDPTSARNAAEVADYYGGAYLNNYDYSNCRDNGWHLLLTIAAFRATGDPYYLNAARIIVERTLERQTPGGGWHRQMVPGHCHCMPRHRGEANFMLGVLANGLEEFYNEVPDPRVAEAVIGGAKQAVAELWVPEVDGFRYTSCPEMKGYIANNDMTAEVLFFAYRLGGDPQYGEIAMRAMRAAFDGGIGSIAHLRWTHHIIYNMDLLRREGLGLDGEKQAALYLLKDDDHPFDFRLCRLSVEPADLTGAATVILPTGERVDCDALGGFPLPEAPAGLYSVQVRALGEPWLPLTELRQCALAVATPCSLRLGRFPGLLNLLPAPGAPRQTVRVKAEGSVRAELRSGDEVVDRAEGVAGEVITLRHEASDGRPLRLSLAGEGVAQVRLGGMRPHVAFYPAQPFDPSRPRVRVEGPRALAPGESDVTLRAVVSDLEGDVETIVWEFPDGTREEGEQVTHRFVTGGAQVVRVTVTDRRGHRSAATHAIVAPPPELASIPADRVTKIEAEDFSDQGLAEVKVYDRTGNSGRMITYWHGTLGHWLQWTVPVAIEGDYRIYLRYATDSENTRRCLTIDGASPGRAFDDMAIPASGGFCTERDDWAYYSAGGEATVPLTVGEHTLRMANLGDGLALDYLLLVRQ